MLLPYRRKLRRWCQRLGKRRQATVFFAALFHHSARDQILKFFVSAKAKHLLAPTSRIAGPQAFVHDVEELFELKRRSFLRQGSNQLFSHQIGKTTRERTFSLHKHERSAYHTFGEMSCKFFPIELSGLALRSVAQRSGRERLRVLRLIAFFQVIKARVGWQSAPVRSPVRRYVRRLCRRKSRHPEKRILTA